GTLSATASRATDLRASLAAAPGTFTNARDTLRRADPTLRAVGNLTTALAPGVRQLRRLERPLDRTLGTVVDVGPVAASSLATARRAAPDLNPLLRKATAIMPDLRSVGAQLTKQLPC